MKKSMKNLIMVGMAVVLVGTSAITIKYASNETGHPPQVNGMPQFEQRGDFNNQNGKSIQDFGNQNGGSTQGKNGNQPQTPPNGNQNDNGQFGKQQPDNNQNSTEDNSGSDNSKSQNDSSQSGSNNQSDSNAPNQKATSADSSALNFESTENTAMQGFNQRGANLQIAETVACYIFAAVQIGIIILILLYLVFSEFNKLTYNQTAAKFKKQDGQ